MRSPEFQPSIISYKNGQNNSIYCLASKLFSSMGQLIGLGIMGLLTGLITQNFAKKRHQEKLGTIGLISCIIAAFVGGFSGIYWGLAAITALGFMIYIQVKA